MPEPTPEQIRDHPARIAPGHWSWGYIAELEKYLEQLAGARALANAQAEDEGLWFEAETAPEAYLQAALRRMHAAVEGTPDA